LCQGERRGENERSLEKRIEGVERVVFGGRMEGFVNKVEKKQGEKRGFLGG